MPVTECRSEETPDEALVLACQHDASGPRGRAAFSALMGRYYRRVYLWCYRYVHDHEQALDLAQEVMINVHRGLPRFEQRARFSSWVFAIAHNRCVSAGRAARLPRDEDVDLESLVDPGAGPEEELEAREQERAFLELVKRQLEPIEQQALWLRCVERMGVDDITRVLGIEMASGARGVLQNARRKLRAAIERREQDDESRRSP